jgi:hypothetical protein
MRTVPRVEQINADWATLTPEAQKEILDADVSAEQLMKHHDRKYWLAVGIGFSRLRTEALRLAHTNNDHHPNYRAHFNLLLARVPDLAELRSRDVASTQHARWMAENWPSVELWLNELEAVDRRSSLRSLNHPSAIKARFEAARRKREQASGKRVPTLVQRQAARIAELETERDQLEQENRVLRRGTDKLTEGQDWTWQDTPQDIARAWLQAQPHKAKQAAAHVLEMSKATVPQPSTRRKRGTE